jgi:hypothetical protein
MYSDIVKKSVNKAPVESNDDIRENVGYSIKSDRVYTTTKPSYGWRRDSNYVSWERAYFRQLLEFRNIFIENVVELYPSMEATLRSPQFFKKFNLFIYKNSSTTISGYLEPMDDELVNLYSEYKEKSNLINEQG